MKPELITHARALLKHYRVAFCDIWGVLHDGVREYAEAGAALERYRADGGTVVLVSNAPFPAGAVADVLAEKQVRRTAWDAIVSSGDIARQHLAEAGYRRIHHIGFDWGLPLFEGAGLGLVELDDAEAIVCTGVADIPGETGDSYRPLLAQALARHLPLVCANPDLVVDVGGLLLPCPGVVGAVYAGMGGEVYWTGKPHRPAYDRALATSARLTGRAVAPAEVLAIGDAAATDIAGATAAGIDALFIAGGIHRDAVMPDGTLDADALARLLAEASVSARAAMTALRW